MTFEGWIPGIVTATKKMKEESRKMRMNPQLMLSAADFKIFSSLMLQLEIHSFDDSRKQRTDDKE